jgi:2,4-dienoyl-CoA reductase-like NADH-dependent reductase (Old Yellow Enzyme family)/thioredoxin reductase
MDFSVERAKGGAALVFSDAVSIDRHHQLMLANPLPYFDNDEQIAKYSRYVDTLHHHGAKTCIQLYHAGRQTSLAKRSGKSPVGPSAVSSMMLGRIPFPDAVEMSVTDIERVIKGFVLASSRAQTAGFDAVDIDGGAGYLIQQFMSPLTNKRRDCWGGSLQNRMRFPLEIIKRIREVLGAEYPLLFDLCLNEFVEGGIIPEQALEMAEILEAASINAFRIHNVNMETYQHMFPGTGSPMAINMPLGRMLKDRLKTAKVMLGQRINDPDLAEKVLQEGAADIILLGRPLIADPYFPRKVMQGKKESIRKCIGCNHCVDNLSYAKSIRCILNPVVGFERDYARLPHTDSPKNILVVGGGVAGLEVSRVAAEIGHRVILAEKTGELGGQVKYASSTPFKDEMKEIVIFYQQQMKDLGVDVRLNLEVDRKAISEMNPDVAIMATGAKPVTPAITGVDNAYVFKAQDVLINPIINYDGPVVVIGGGSLGAEMAEMFVMQGREVTLIEKKKAIAEDMGLMMALSFHERMDKYRINIVTGATVDLINDNKVYYTLDDGEESEVSAACVVLATGYSANRTLEADLQELVGEVVMVGDCQSPRKIINAVHEGFHAARLI